MDTNRIPSVRNISDHPHYFGAYLNLARHNVYLIINHLTDVFDKLKFNKINDDENIGQGDHILHNIFDPDQKTYEDIRFSVFNYLTKRHHLPLLNAFKYQQSDDDKLVEKNIDFAALHNFLTLAFKEITELRNHFSHSLAIDDNGYEIEKSEYVGMEILLHLDNIFSLAPSFSIARHAETFSSSDFSHVNGYKIIDDQKLTEQGLYFFICLFLERKDAVKFIKRLKGFKNESTPPFKATIKAFTAFALKVPDERLGNENPKFSLLMDILTELNKCPPILYNQLDKKHKDIFQPKVDDEARNNILDNTKYEDINEEEILNLLYEQLALKRTGDRFPYFALRFLDEIEAFSRIRFQIALGKLQVQAARKKKILNTTAPRIITKRITVYGRLSDFLDKEDGLNDYYKEKYKDDSKYSEESGLFEFEQFAPHYNIVNNKIGFYLFDAEDPEKKKIPDLFIDDDSLNKPAGFLSVNELPKLLALILLTSRNEISTLAEEVIVDFIENKNPLIFDPETIRSIRQKMNYEPEVLTKKIYDNTKYVGKREKEKRSEYNYFTKQRSELLAQHLPEGIRPDHLPGVIKDYLYKKLPISKDKHISLFLRVEKDSVKKLLKYAERGLSPKIGEIATIIARDILDMVVSEDLKKKHSQPYYNKLQNKIAYFGLNREEIVDLCQEMGLLDRNSGHVFLRKNLIMNSSGILDFYKNYLEEKNKWIIAIKDKLFSKSGKYKGSEKVILPYKYQSRIDKIHEEPNLKKWMSEKIKQSINLPTTIFNSLIENNLRNHLDNKGTAFRENEKFSTLLEKYVDADKQAFYDYPRHYSKRDNGRHLPVIIDTWENKYKNLCKKHHRKIADTEKKIKYEITRDRVLSMMAKRLIQDDHTINLDRPINLAEVHPLSEVNPLDRPIKFAQKVIRKGKESYFTIIAEDNQKQKNQVAQWQNLDRLIREKFTRMDEEAKKVFLDTCTPGDKEILLGQQHYEWTIKDFGKYKRFIADRRIPNLATYFKDKEIPYSLLYYQLSEYDRYREEVFKQIFNLEKYIHTNYKEEIIKIELQNRDQEKLNNKTVFSEVQFKIYTKWMSDNGIDTEIIKSIRNKFMHNEFPKLEKIDQITPEQMSNFFEKHQEAGYKDTADLSIPKKINELLSEEIDRIRHEIEMKK